jgi:hypothetical protein
LTGAVFDFVRLASTGGEFGLVAGELGGAVAAGVAATEPIESMLQGKFW